MNGDVYFRSQRDEHLNQLKSFLRIPSVSAESSHKTDVRKAAQWLADECSRIGLSAVQLMETAGHPVVYAERIDHPGAPVALIYGHYDVQPVDPLNLWQTPPFEPDIRNGKLYARGASDDKGQVFIHLKVLQAILSAHGQLPFNVKLLIEGEEEIGSPSLAPFIEQHKELLRADVVVISDTGLYAPGVPSLTYGLRGLADMEVHVRGAARDLHSGIYGGAAPNAARGLAELVASLHRPDGAVAVEGFYDNIRPVTETELESFRSLQFDEEALKAELGVGALPGEPGFTALERLWIRPTLEINGIFGGFQGEGPKTVIPAFAGAKMTCRLVPDQDPQHVMNVIEQHVRARCPAGLTLDVIRRASARPAVTPIDHPAIRAAAAAMQEAYGGQTRFIRSGGSIPVVITFQTRLNAPSVLMGFGLETENFHAPNEHFHLENFDKGLRAVHSFWFKLAETMR